MPESKSTTSPTKRVARTVLLSAETEKAILELVGRVPGASVHLALVAAVELGLSRLDEQTLLQAILRRWSRRER